jgi:hypothetical protein
MSKSTYQKNNPNLRQPKMQHVRHVKPEYFAHEGINDMTVNARLAEIGTWTCCDKYGRFEWLPRALKRLVMPYDDVNFESLMLEWVNHGFAERYEVDDKFYGRFFNWEKHQGINLREKQSCFEYPTPPHVSARASTVQAPTAHVQARVQSEQEGKGEGEGEGEQKEEQKRESEQEIPAAAPSADVAVESKPKTLSPSRDLSPESKAPQGKAGGQKTILSAVEYVEQVIERAKVLSAGKASFSKTAKTEMIEALRHLGSFNKQEMDYAIQARLDLCRDDVSYAIFGSSLAADFVASVRAHRERAANANTNAEDKRLGDQWRKDFRAIWDDPSIELHEWLVVHQPTGDANDDCEQLDEDAQNYRKQLLQQRALETPAPESPAPEPAPKVAEIPKPKPIVIKPGMDFAAELARSRRG